MHSAILFLVFKRPDSTARVFESIRAARPPRLYIAADGPRITRPDEAELCRQVRAVVTAVDWPCEVKTLFRRYNLGCKLAVSDAISWFFEQEKEGIILEDDVLPHPDFFSFCENLLEYYRDDERVMHIGGNNFQCGMRYDQSSYYFSNFNHVWGWASWRKSWSKFELSMPGLEEFIANKLNKFCSDISMDFISDSLRDTLKGAINSWAYIWMYNIWASGGLSICPAVNLAKNIGFSEQATHSKDSFWKYLEAEPLPQAPSGGLIHPPAVKINATADDCTCKLVFNRDCEDIKPYIKEAFRRFDAGLYHETLSILSMIRKFIPDDLEMLKLEAASRVNCEDYGNAIPLLK